MGTNACFAQVLSFSLLILIIFIVGIVIAYYILFYSSHGLWNVLLFRHKKPRFFSGPKSIKFGDPRKCGLSCAKHFFIEGNDGILGAWYADRGGICHGFALYLHGQGRTRASTSRVKTVEVMSNFGFRVLTIDYRGFGDSDGVPTEKGVVEDAKTALKWLRMIRNSKNSDAPIIVWGHSLGTAIALELYSQECDQDQIDGLVLEGALVSIHNELSSKTLVYKRKALCLYEYTERKSLQSFNNAKVIGNVNCPLLFLHSQDDPVISHKKSIELFKKVNPKVKEYSNYALFNECFGHNHINCSQKLTDYLTDFIETIENFRKLQKRM